MSRVGKLPIAVPKSIKIEIADGSIDFTCGDVKKNYKHSSLVKVEHDDDFIRLSSKNPRISGSSMLVGMNRSNINNIISGLKQPFQIILEINGVGYKASVNAGILTLTLGYSHDILYVVPKNIIIQFEKPNLIKIISDDKVLVGQVASEIISFRKPEPYKGKGVKILGSKILRKEGKKK